MSLLRQGGHYVLFGLVQLLLDWLLMVLLSRAGVPVAVANVSGRLLAALAGFWLNRRYTFAGHLAGPGRAQFARFVAFWILATVLSTVSVSAIDRHAGLGWAWAAKPAVEAALAVLGFLASRHWIYR